MTVSTLAVSSPETIRALVQRAGLRIVKESKVDATNVYVVDARLRCPPLYAQIGVGRGSGP